MLNEHIRTCCRLAVCACFLVAVSCGGCQQMPQVCGTGETLVDGECVTLGDIPEIPKPPNADTEAPLQSESITVVLPLKADFVATAKAGTCTWELRSRKCFCRGVIICGVGRSPCLGECDADIDHGTVTAHSSDLEISGQNISSSVRPWPALFMEEGEIIINPRTLSSEGQRDGFIDIKVFDLPGCGVCQRVPPDGGNSCVIGFYWIRECPPITQLVYLKRERVWERVPVDGQGALFVRLDEGTQFSISTSYRSGFSTEESESLGETFSYGANAGAGGGGVTIGASINQAVTETFSTTTTYSESTTVTHTQTVSGVAGKISVFMLWELVERYTITDAEGNPYTDPNYEWAGWGVLDPDDDEPFKALEIRGVALELDLTTFDAN